MERFKIYLYSKLIRSTTDGRIVLTDSAAISEASTFDENFSIAENDKITLTFSIYEKLHNGEPNPFIEYLVPESVLGLELPDRESNTEKPGHIGAYYKLKVLERSPVFNEENTMYNIVAVDYASAVYSKQAEGLSIEMTGSLRSIAEEILGMTRKNTLYKDLNTNFAKIYQEKTWLNTLKDNKIIYSLPYVNFKHTNMSYFKNNKPIMKFFVTDKFQDGEEYELRMQVVASRVTQNTDTLPIDFAVGVVGRTLNGQESFDYVDARVTNISQPVTIRSRFTYSNGLVNDKTDAIELYLHEINNPEHGVKWPTTGTMEITIANVQITRSRKRTEERKETDTALYINHLGNFADFQLPEKGKNIDIEMTFAANNANLYSALVSLATLFEAEVRFDYIMNGVYFVSKKKRSYKGYRLDPRINLSSLSRPESSNDFATILHVEGSGDVDGIIPSVPVEWRRFLSVCADEDFKNSSYFKTYNSTNTYLSLVNTVASYIDPSESEVERLYEIKKFAEHMDKVPNFESTLYDFSYFEEIGLLEDKYPFLVDLVTNTVRKLNISLNVNTYRYYSIYSDFATQLQQVAFYSSLINTEEKFLYTTRMKLLGNDAPQKYTSSWVAYMNAIDAAQANIYNFRTELYNLIGLDENGAGLPGYLESGSFIHNACMLFGYQNKDDNGIQKLIDENSEKIREKDQERADLEAKIIELQDKIDASGSSFITEALEVELAGARSNLDRIANYIGRSEIDEENNQIYRGSYVIEGALYAAAKKAMASQEVAIPTQLKSKNLSLFKLLFDRENPHNLIVRKEKELEALMDEYEAFALEARYQNSDEVTPEGLLEQGLLSFVKINRPKVSYNISAIHIGALQDYSFIEHPEIGDKIKIDEKLYLSYEPEDTDYLVIVGYKERLREPNSLELTVEKDDESELLVRRMLEQSNFIQMNKSKPASNRSVPVPREFSDRIDSIEESLTHLEETELSIVGLFEGMVKK